MFNFTKKLLKNVSLVACALLMVACNKPTDPPTVDTPTAEQEYTLTYAAGGENVEGLAAATKHKKGEAVKLAAAPTREGFTFESWKDGVNTYAAGASFTMPAKDVTMTAQWKNNETGEIEQTYALTYAAGTTDAVEGLNTTSIEYPEGSTVALAAAPTRDGYNFTKWSDGTNQYDANASFTMPANAVVMTALWEAKTPGGNPDDEEDIEDPNKPSLAFTKPMATINAVVGENFTIDFSITNPSAATQQSGLKWQATFDPYNAATVTSFENGKLIFKPLSAGNHTLTVQLSDPDGNYKAATEEITLNVTAPAVSGDFSFTGTVTNDATEDTPEATFTLTDVTDSSAKLTFSNFSAFTTQLGTKLNDLHPGGLEVTVSNKAGNDFQFNGKMSWSNGWSDKEVTINGTVTDNSITVTLTDGSATYTFTGTK